MNEHDKIMMYLIALSRLLDVDPKKLGAETLDTKANAEFMIKLSEGMLKKIIVDKKMSAEETAEITKAHNHMKKMMEIGRYEDNDDGFKR